MNDLPSPRSPQISVSLPSGILLGRAHEIGTLEPGKFADVLVVDGDVLSDIRLLEDRSHFIAVMQGGIAKAGQLSQNPNQST
jgi:hypothetical protein